MTTGAPPSAAHQVHLRATAPDDQALRSPCPRPATLSDTTVPRQAGDQGQVLLMGASDLLGHPRSRAIPERIPDCSGAERPTRNRHLRVVRSPLPLATLAGDGMSPSVSRRRPGT